MPRRIPGSREEESWFSEDHLEGLERADEADDLRSPIPTQMISNGEYMPFPQTDQQRHVEHRVKEISDAAAKIAISDTPARMAASKPRLFATSTV